MHHLPNTPTHAPPPHPTPYNFAFLEHSLYIFIILQRSTFFAKIDFFRHARAYSLYAVVLKGSSRVPGAGTRDEPLRTSAWEANVRTVRTSSYAAG